MAKATERKLNALHGAVAEALVEIIEDKEEVTEFNEDGFEVGTGKQARTASPAMMAAAIKFLKDNDITADIEQDENMSRLDDVLKKKSTYSRRNAHEAAKESIN